MNTAVRSESVIDEKPKSVVSNKEVIVSTQDTNEPYSIFKEKSNKPFSAQYFDIDNLSESEVFKDELSTIDSYMLELVKRGVLSDDKEAVSKKIKSIEKMANIDILESTALRMKKLSAFMKYLREIDYAI